jgi:hypothetical protein
VKPTLWESCKGNLRELVPYLIAAAIYIPIGLWNPHFILNWTPAYILLLIVCWIVPSLWRRWRSR